MNEHAHMQLHIHRYFLMPTPQRIPLHQSARAHFPSSILKLQTYMHRHNITENEQPNGQDIKKQEKNMTLTSHSMLHP
jgi:hypothetical protein